MLGLGEQIDSQMHRDYLLKNLNAEKIKKEAEI